MKQSKTTKSCSYNKSSDHCDGVVQDCSNSIASSLELLQSCTSCRFNVYNGNPSTGRMASWYWDPSESIKPHGFNSVAPGRWCSDLNSFDAGEGIFWLWGSVTWLLMPWLLKSLEHSRHGIGCVTCAGRSSVSSLGYFLCEIVLPNSGIHLIVTSHWAPKPLCCI